MENTDRKQRIEERRRRIQDRLNMSGAVQQSDNSQYQQQQSQQSLPEQKITEQLNLLKVTQQNYASQIEQLQKRADAEQTLIFSNDTAAEQKRRQVLEQLKQQNDQQQAAFEMRWGNLLARRQPEELLAGLIELRNIMLNSLQQKDDITKAFEDYLNNIDDDYLRLMNEQQNEVEEIMNFTRKSIDQLKQKCSEAVNQCEKAFDQERERFAKERDDKLDQIRQDISKIEDNYVEKRQQACQDYVSQLQNTILLDYDQFSKLKRELEAENVALHSQLEEMRAVYILNTEKLDYNYKLLASRDIECQNLIVQQKKKLAKLQTQKNNLVARHQQVDEQVRAENLELSLQYRRLANSYCELQKKFQLFEKADNEQFKKLWTYHEKQVGERLKQLLLTEQVINESVLCAAPKCEVDENSLMQQIKHMLQRLQTNTRLTHDQSTNAEIAEQQFDITKSINAVSSCKFGKETAEKRLDDLAKALNFMASDDLIKTSNAEIQKIDQTHRIETLITTLGIRNASELDLLLLHITEEGKAQKLVQRDKLIDNLIHFANALKDKRDSSKNKDGQLKDQKEKDPTQQGIWSVKDVENFWKELGFIACTQKATTWGMLEDVLKRYQEVLMARVDLVVRNDELAGQNEELRSLLQQYVDGEKRDLTGADVEYVQVGSGINNVQKDRMRQ